MNYAWNCWTPPTIITVNNDMDTARVKQPVSNNQPFFSNRLVRRWIDTLLIQVHNTWLWPTINWWLAMGNDGYDPPGLAADCGSWWFKRSLYFLDHHILLLLQLPQTLLMLRVDSFASHGAQFLLKCEGKGKSSFVNTNMREVPTGVRNFHSLQAWINVQWEIVTKPPPA